MKAIDKIIFNELASRKAVVLPGVGTLGVVRHTAEIKGGELKSPVNQVVYSKHEAKDAFSIISIMESIGMPRDAATVAYGEWLSEAKGGDGTVNIGGVGKIKNDIFTPTVELEQLLNPVRSQNTSQARAENASSCASAGAPVHHTTHHAAAHHTAAHHAAHYSSVPPAMYEKRRHPNLLTNILLGVIILLLLGFTTLFVVDRVLTHGGVFDKGFWGMKCHVSKHNVYKPVVSAPVVVPTQEVPAVVTPAETVAPAVARNYHLIAGSFILESSADELIARYRRQFPDLTVEKFFTPAWVKVSVYQGETRADAEEAKRRLASRLGNWDMWVYHKR
ncbi:MAG: SPOR domain-containing protein [Rikenellaceae bacterium]|nr:SPOR domain-containing protein [Rikenellaceae bacterium]MCL2692092.1 SPOR domain-containing protein [Rikenellaceae bacterium]